MIALVVNGTVTRTASTPPEVWRRPNGTAVAGYHLRPDLWVADGWLPVVETNAGPGPLETGTHSDAIGPTQVARTWMNIANATAVNADTIRTQATASLQANRDFLTVVSPTNAQTLAQVRALTRQMNGLIRHMLGAFDGTN